jgi:PAS domain S-box-containing protein
MVAQEKKYHFYKCLNGLVVVAVPIVINGEHIANLFSGQFFFEEPDIPFFKKQAEKCGFDEKEYLAALRKVPIVSEEKVKTVMDFLLNMTQMISEITIQKIEQAELNKTIRESEEKLKSIFNNMTDVVWSISWPDLTHNFISPSLEKLYGRSKQDLLDNPNLFQDITHPDDQHLTEKAMKQLLDEGKAERECRIIKPDGSIVWVNDRSKMIYDENQQPMRVDGVTRDITERKAIQQKLQNTVNDQNLMLDNDPTLIYFKDCNNNIIRVTESVAKATGLTREEIEGRPSKEIYPDLADRYWKDDLEVIKSGTPKHNIVEPLTGVDGSSHWLLTTKVPVKNDSGEIVGICVFATDITDLENAELELIAAKEKAEESDRLKSAFLANMSHEIRTPMNGILGFADLLKEPGLTGDEQQQYIEIIEKSGARMLNIINGIVDISKIEAGLMKCDMKESNINEQIEYVYTFFRPQVKAKGMQLILSNALPAGQEKIITDREKLYAILTNLIKNAIKYSKEGAIEYGCNKKGSLLEFFIRDTGIGIPKDRQHAIFDRFVQADIEDKEAREGVGLGLAISKAYVEMLGGKIWVESEEGKGSTFYFTLPYNPDPKKETTDQQHASIDKADTIRKLKILIAEDDEVSEMLIDRYLRMHSKEILKARTGLEAVEVCRNNPDIDLILMDIRMPDMGGYEATRQIREFNKKVIIIAQTAYGLTGDRGKSLKAGCNDYVAKPIKKTELQEMIQKHFGK